MRLGSGVRLLACCLAVCVLVVLAVESGARAAKARRTTALKVSVTGWGTLRVAGQHSFSCRANSCNHTFHVRRGRRTVVTATPSSGWRLSRWAGACKGSSAKCSLRLRTGRRAAVTFVPPGDRINPYPLGTVMTLYGGWKLRVNSAILDADTQVEAVTDANGNHLNSAPPAGAQYTLVNVSLTYLGGGFGSVGQYVFTWLGAAGARNTAYQATCSPPPLDLSVVFQPAVAGQATTGNLCFEIASRDAARLLLGGYREVGGATVWFALR